MSRLAPFVDAATSNDPVNYANTFISYYTYGQALALGIDLAIREHFPGKSLDDWMKTMWREHPDIDKPYDVEDLKKALGDAVGDKAFAERIFQNHIYGKEIMPYEELLAHAGFLLEKRAGGRPWIGAPQLSFAGGGAEIMAPTLHGSPIYEAGLDRGDRITQFDGKSLASQQDLTAILEAHKPGDKMKLRVETRGGRKDLELDASRGAASRDEALRTGRQGTDAANDGFPRSVVGQQSGAPAAQTREILPRLQAHLGVRV